MEREATGNEALRGGPRCDVGSTAESSRSTRARSSVVRLERDRIGRLLDDLLAAAAAVDEAPRGSGDAHEEQRPGGERVLGLDAHAAVTAVEAAFAEWPSRVVGLVHSRSPSRSAHRSTSVLP